MKKILIILSLISIIFSNSFAYTPTEKEQTLLTEVYQKVDKINSSVYRKLYNQINILKSKYTNSPKATYLLNELGNYIRSKIDNEKLYEVLDVSDGDTIKINYNGQKTTLRLIGIDTPESFDTRFGYKECFGDEASNYLKKLLAGKKVSIEFDETQDKVDKYDRLLVYIKLDGENINAKLIQEGYAWEYTYETAYKYQDEFKEYETQAKNSLKLLWATDTCNGERKAINSSQNTTKTTTSETNSQLFYDPNNKDYLNMGFNCSKTKYCKYMSSCDEVKYYFYVCKAGTFDGDKDEIPCEEVCGSVKK